MTHDPRRIRLTIYGSPAPQGSKKFVGTTKKGKGILVESSAKVKPWRDDVKAAAEAMLARHTVRPPPIDAPVFVRIVFTLPKPSSAPKKRKTYAMRKPDIDKLVRSTFDALGDAGVWADDARVVELQALKVFPGEHAESLPAPGATLWIQEIP